MVPVLPLRPCGRERARPDQQHQVSIKSSTNLFLGSHELIFHDLFYLLVLNLYIYKQITNLDYLRYAHTRKCRNTN
jgi:hypothetical protein